MRSSRSETRRRRQRNRRLTFIICIALAVIAVITAIVVGYGDIYRNEKQFKDFADSHFESGEMYDSVEIEKTDYTYEEEYYFGTVGHFLRKHRFGTIRRR